MLFLSSFKVSIYEPFFEGELDEAEGSPDDVSTELDNESVRDPG
jgi:hypothetical protein